MRIERSPPFLSTVSIEMGMDKNIQDSIIRAERLWNSFKGQIG